MLRLCILSLFGSWCLAACTGNGGPVQDPPDLVLCEPGDPDCSTEIIELDRSGLFSGIEVLCLGCTAPYTPPTLLPLRSGKRDGRTLWALQGDYAYFSDRFCKFVVVPHGFATDLASIPRLGRLAYNPANYAEAALVHDWLYAIGEPGMRLPADQMFRDVLIETGREDSARRLFEFTRAGGDGGYGLETDFVFWDDEERELDFAREKPRTGFLKKSEADALVGSDIRWSFVEGRIVYAPDGSVPGAEHISNCTPK